VNTELKIVQFDFGADLRALKRSRSAFDAAAKVRAVMHTVKPMMMNVSSIAQDHGSIRVEMRGPIDTYVGGLAAEAAGGVPIIMHSGDGEQTGFLLTRKFELTPEQAARLGRRLLDRTQSSPPA
jgi:hypothetical protein